MWFVTFGHTNVSHWGSLRWHLHFENWFFLSFQNSKMASRPLFLLCSRRAPASSLTAALPNNTRSNAAPCAPLCITLESRMYPCTLRLCLACTWFNKKNCYQVCLVLNLFLSKVQRFSWNYWPRKNCSYFSRVGHKNLKLTSQFLSRKCKILKFAIMSAKKWAWKQVCALALGLSYYVTRYFLQFSLSASYQI